PIIFWTPCDVQLPRPPTTALSKKLHSLLSSIRRTIQTRGHSCADPRPSRRLGRAYHFCRIAFRLRPTFARITSDAHPFGMLSTLILAGGGLLALARRRRRQLVA